jgi:hypothetical protein
MIRYRQKIFFLPLLINGALVGSSLLGVAQQKKSDEQNAEEASRQADLMKEQNRRLDNIAEKVGKDPSAVGQIPDIMQNKPHEKFYGLINPTTLKNGKLFVKDMVGLASRHKGKMAGLLVSGAGMSLAGYGANKYIQHDMKKSGLTDVMTGEDQSQPGTKSYSLASLMGDTTRRGLKVGRRAIKNNMTSTLAFGGLTAIPAVMAYKADKRAIKDQLASTELPDQQVGSVLSGISGPQQKQYASPASVMRLVRMNGIKSVAGNFFKNGPANIKKGASAAWNATKSGFKTFRDHPAQTLLGTASNLSMGGGKAGVKAVAEDLKLHGKSSWTQAMAKKMTFLDKNGVVQPSKIALAASIPVGMGMMKVGWEGGQKAMDKATRAIDPNAFKYQDFKDKQVQQQQQDMQQYYQPPIQ